MKKRKDMSRKWEKGQRCAGFRWTVSGRAQTGRNSQWEGRIIMISCCWEKRALGKQEGCLLSPRPALNDKRKCYPDMMGISKMAVQRMESVQGPIALPCENKHRRHHCADDISLGSLKKHQPCDWSWEKKAPDIFILLQSQTQILIHWRLLILKVQVFCFSSVTHRHWSVAPFPIINS